MEIYLIIAIVVMFVIGYFIGNRGKKEVPVENTERIGMLEASIQDYKANIKEQENIISTLNEKITSLVSDRDVHKANEENALKQVELQRAQFESLRSQDNDRYEKMREEQKNAYEKQINDLKESYNAHLQEQKEAFDKQIALAKDNSDKQLTTLKKMNEELVENQKTIFQEQIKTASEQIKTTSEQVLKAREEELGLRNKEQLSAILNPLKEGIAQMKDAVEKSDKQHSETMVRLDATIKNSIAQSREVGERADKLAQALTGENKTQGNFGELRLKQLLEDMGLEEGVQFEEQQTMTDAHGRVLHNDENGRRMIPDVILHFPDQRDVIIDSKMSFKAFEDYHNADTDEARQEALLRHIVSVRRHVEELSRKNYSSYIKEGRGKLDFVLMYVFSESALQLALSNEPTLWKEAYDKGVIITGSQNLYMMLRVLEMTWRQVRQVENQENMMKVANMVIDRVQMFYERFMKVDEMLGKTQKAFDEVKNISSSSGQSIEVAARNLVKYGAKENTKRKYLLKKSESDEPALEE